MADINAVSLVGNLGKPPEVKYFESGAVICTFSLACKRNRSKDTVWFDVECWDKQAEFAANFLQKGSKIAVTGEIRFDHWNDKTTGLPRRKPVIRIDSIDSCSKKGEVEGGGYQQSTDGLTPTADVNVDDIPF